MEDEVAMVDEISYHRSAEVHANLDTWIRACPCPEWNVDGIQILPLLRWHGQTVPRQEKEVNLMNVERVIFLGPVLNGPVLDGYLRRGNRRRIVRIEELRSLPVHGRGQSDGVAIKAET